MPDEIDPSKQGQAGADAIEAKPQYLTRETFGEALKELLPGLLNPAITGHLKRFESKVEQRFAALTPKPAEAASEVDDASAGVEVEQPVAKPAAKVAKPAAQAAREEPVVVPPDPRIAEMEKRLAKLTKDAEKAQQQAAAERRQRLEEQGYEAVKGQLRGKVHAGIEDDILDAWRARGNVTVGDDGSVRLKFGSTDEPEEGFDVGTGVVTFLKSDRAKPYLPPPNGAQRGNGARVPSQGRSPAVGGTTNAETAFEGKYGKPLGKAIFG